MSGYTEDRESWAAQLRKPEDGGLIGWLIDWLIDWLSRYTEDRESWAAKLREPEDGCATCGFWRDSLQDCEQCNEVNNFSKYSK